MKKLSLVLLCLTLISSICGCTSSSELDTSRIPLSTYNDRVKEKCVSVDITESKYVNYLESDTNIYIPQWAAGSGEVVRTVVNIDGVNIDILSCRSIDGTFKVAYGISVHCYMTGKGFYRVNEDGNLFCESCYNTYTLDVMSAQTSYNPFICSPEPIAPEDYTLVSRAFVPSNVESYLWVDNERGLTDEDVIVIHYDVLQQFVTKLRDSAKGQIDYEWNWRVNLEQ